MTETHWSSDVPVSLPEPIAQASKEEPRIPMGGFVFTVDGLFHDIDQSLHDELSLPTFSPQPATEVIYDDEPDSIEFG